MAKKQNYLNYNFTEFAESINKNPANTSLNDRLKKFYKMYKFKETDFKKDNSSDTNYEFDCLWFDIFKTMIELDNKNPYYRKNKKFENVKASEIIEFRQLLIDKISTFPNHLKKVIINSDSYFNAFVSVNDISTLINKISELIVAIVYCSTASGGSLISSFLEDIDKLTSDYIEQFICFENAKAQEKLNETHFNTSIKNTKKQQNASTTICDLDTPNLDILLTELMRFFMKNNIHFNTYFSVAENNYLFQNGISDLTKLQEKDLENIKKKYFELVDLHFFNPEDSLKQKNYIYTGQMRLNNYKKYISPNEDISNEIENRKKLTFEEIKKQRIEFTKKRIKDLEVFIDRHNDELQELNTKLQYLEKDDEFVQNEEDIYIAFYLEYFKLYKKIQDISKSIPFKNVFEYTDLLFGQVLLAYMKKESNKLTSD